eukprot:UN12293
MSVKALQILSRRVGVNRITRISRIHTHSQRSFHKHKWKRGWMHRRSWNHNHFRTHGHWWGHPHHVHRYYKHPLSFAGTSLAMIISYHKYQSIVWALISGCFSWLYVGYSVFEDYNKQDKSAKELLNNEVDELSVEIEKLNTIYQQLQGAVGDIKQEYDRKMNKTGTLILDDDDVGSGTA